MRTLGCIFLVLNVFVFHNAQSVVVFPTISNISGNFYIASPTETFSNDEINCPSNSSNCYIFCEYSSSDCSYLTVNASLVSNLYIVCSKQTSCRDIEIISGPSYLAYIDCTDYGSCREMYLRLQTTENVYLNCNYSGSITTNAAACYFGIIAAPNATNFHLNCGNYDCRALRVDITYVSNSTNFVFDSYGGYALRIDAAQIPNNLSLQCTKYSACKGIEVKCPFNSYCNIDCGVDYFGCYDANIYFTDYYDDTPNNYLNMDCGDKLENQVCQTSNMNCLSGVGYSVLPEQLTTYTYGCNTLGCCPTVRDIVNCSQYIDNQCIINCTTTNDCDNALIDYLMIEDENNITISNLTVNCEQCEYSLINCPSMECNINCKNCQESYFVAQYTNIVNILCHSNGNACGSAIIQIQNVESFNIECTDPSKWSVCSKLRYIDMYNIKSFNMICDGYIGCSYFQIRDAFNINEFNLKCNGDSSTCSGSVISINNVNNANIQCTDLSSCSGVNYHIKNVTNNIDIICGNSIQNGTYTSSCSNSRFNVIGNIDYNVTVNTICGGKDCEGSIFDFSKVNTIDFVCNNERSCYLGTIYGNMSNHFDIHCIGTGYPGSCFGLDVYPPSSMEKSTNVYCGGNENACTSLQFFVPSTFYPNYLEFNCSNITFCDGVGILNGLNFECIDSRYKYYGYRRDSDIVSPSLVSMDYTNMSYGCSTNRCCPWSNNEIIFCNEYDADCIINCSLDADKCINKYINVSNITQSLTVICDLYESCSWAVILCPNKEGAICNVECNANESCHHLRIEYNHYATSINVSCSDDDKLVNNINGKMNVCDNMNIFAFNATNINFQCNQITCDDVWIHALSADNINIKCLSKVNQSENGACIHLTVEGHNVSSNIDLQCIGYKSCFQPYLNMYYANSVYMNIGGDFGLYYGDIRVYYVSSFVLNCASQIYERGCIFANFYLPQFGSGNGYINCYGTGCLQLYIFEIDDIWDHITFTFNECAQCTDINSMGLECIENIKVYCNTLQSYPQTYPYRPPYDFGSYRNNTAINENKCIDNNICSCSYITNQFIMNHVNDITNNLCIIPPTLSPTMDPTFNPTTNPTAIPSSITRDPSLSPTHEPSFSPTTYSPSISTPNPTINPSISTRIIILKQATTDIISKQETNSSVFLITIILIIFLIIIVFGIVIGYFWCNKKKQSDPNQNVMDHAKINQHSQIKEMQTVQLMQVSQPINQQNNNENIINNPKIKGMRTNNQGIEGKQQPITFQ